MTKLQWKIDDSLSRFYQTPQSHMDIVGSDSPVFLGALLSLEKTRWSTRPHLVVVSDSNQTDQLIQSLQFFDPSIQPYVLSSADVGLYSGLYPSRRLGADRVRWLWQARNARPGDIFVASLESLLQKTLPYNVLTDRHRLVKKGELLFDHFAEILSSWGYSQTPIVEDVGTFSVRGGIVDVYSPSQTLPVRMELFGDVIDSIHLFDPETQRRLKDIAQFEIIAAHEIQFSEEARQSASKYFQHTLANRDVPKDEAQNFLHHLALGQYLHGMEFLIPGFYPKLESPLEHFSQSLNIWSLDSLGLDRAYDELKSQLKQDFDAAESILIQTPAQDFYSDREKLPWPEDSKRISLSKIHLEGESEEAAILPVSVNHLEEVLQKVKKLSGNASEISEFFKEKIREWKQLDQFVCFALATASQAERLKVLLDRAQVDAVFVEESEEIDWENLKTEQSGTNKIHLVLRHLPASMRFANENFVIIRDADIFGRTTTRGNQRSHAKGGKKTPAGISSDAKAFALNFSDLKIGDLIVHNLHGIGVYEGLKVMEIQGIPAEFIQLKYKDNDRLYLPVYRINQIHKYSGPSSPALIDKLGGTGWQKTKTKVRAHLRDIASELLEIYAKRQLATRPHFKTIDDDYRAFEAAFPYEETDDQLKAIEDILADLQKEQPMDRLVCGDVGFGKTEVAMRAAFKVAQEGRQVAVIAPTTVLTFQHLETFQKRFKNWPFVIRSLNRFVPNSEIKKTLAELKEGKVDILIGTHRLLSQDVRFKDLGLLIVDEEQRFGVKHKERLRKLRAELDTLAMSATPIPRTLNLSLVGVRDLSLINTPPVDRLPTRTFVCKFDRETIRKAVMSEVQRGGQVYFIHNRVQSIYGLADELREILPNVRMKVAHGQMEEGQLEKVMVEFFHQELDVLLCTTIVESGMDVPTANTMFIDKSHQLGLSQLYQLRGRVGRSKERAYCYLMIPQNQTLDKQAQERLRIIQENTSLGSGIRIAQYDLELRGAGDILGEDQAGHINAVGYELYLELLEDAVLRARGEEPKDIELEPEINVKIPALIPDAYIPDIRVRLAYYKALAGIETPDDLDRIEEELRDQFGKPPEQVINLMGLMLIRKHCRELGVRDLSSGKLGVTLAFTEKTSLSPQKAVELTARANKKYSLTPDSRLTIRMTEITWPRIVEELDYLLRL